MMRTTREQLEEGAYYKARYLRAEQEARYAEKHAAREHARADSIQGELKKAQFELQKRDDLG
jgi:hypothetical protein